MNKPRSKSEEKRQQIIEASTRLFTEQGFAQTSMDQVAKAAGVSKQTVYSHFGSKDELFVDAVSRKCVSHNMAGLMHDKIDDPQQALSDMAFSFIDLLLTEEVVSTHRTCVGESEAYPHVSRLFYSAGPERTITEIAECMALFDQRGLLSISEPRFAAVQLLCMVKGEICLQSEYNVEKRLSDDKVKAYIHSCVAMFLRGYAKS